MSLTDKLLDRVFKVHSLKAEVQRLGQKLAEARSLNDWDKQQELVELRAAVARLTPQKQFRILAKGPCLPGTSTRETRFLSITSVASTEGVTTISVDAPWLLPVGGAP